MEASPLARAIAAEQLTYVERLSERFDLEPAVRSLLVDDCGRAAMLGALALVCPTCRGRSFVLTAKASGIDICLRCTDCGTSAWLELKGYGTHFNCHWRSCGHAAHPEGHCQLGGGAAGRAAFILDVEDRPAEKDAGDACGNHDGWIVLDFAAVTEAIADAGIAAGPGGGDVAVGVARVFAVAKGMPELMARLAGLPGRSGPEPAATPPQVARYLVRGVFRDRRKLDRVVRVLGTRGVESQALVRAFDLRLWVKGDIYVGCYDSLGESGEPVTYTVGRMDDDAAMVWDLEDGQQASVRLLAPDHLGLMTWPGAQGIANDPAEYVAELVMTNAIG